ncbi:ATP-grasp domain-containing protein [Halobacillus sp. Marseille-P3879]|uniref:ATP-grasp domain-containing protein n=1 Tax=Halobacillus sp. Marseille-P3879 TaxID=2045014 RepID=UPI000C7A57D6|nr:ATP-grasp domain-containing protein [Halobacillus sp. Marseille-P3879]
MGRMNVLVTGIGGPTAQGILQALKEKENVHIVGADRRRVTSGNQFCDKTYQIPRFTQEDHYKKAIAEIVDKEEIDAVYPCLHEEIEIYHTFREELPVKVALPQSCHFEILRDKESTYHYLQEINLDAYVPKYYGFNHATELREIADNYFTDDEYIVAKQVEGHGSLGFAILTDRDNFLEALKKGQNKVLNINDYCEIDTGERRIAMEYMDGMEYSVDVFIHEGEVIVAVPRERDGVSSGLVLDGKVVYNEELIEAATLITRQLATNGFINLQFIAAGDGYKLTDVNPRFCGSQIMSLGAEVNFPYLFLQYNVLGEYPEVDPKWNMRMIRYRDHLFVDENKDNST